MPMIDVIPPSHDLEQDLGRAALETVAAELGRAAGVELSIKSLPSAASSRGAAAMAICSSITGECMCATFDVRCLAW